MTCKMLCRCANAHMQKRAACSPSLLLASARGFLLFLTGDDLSQHHDAVAVHESDARQALTILESVANQRLLWLELALGHLIRLQRVGLLHLLTASLLSHLPIDLRDAAG